MAKKAASKTKTRTLETGYLVMATEKRSGKTFPMTFDMSRLSKEDADEIMQVYRDDKKYSLRIHRVTITIED